MSRYKAFSIHFAVSALVVLSFLGLVVFVLYPSPYLEISGTRRVLTLLVVVDMVLGPLMTLIIFRSGKPGLKTDLSIIAAIQIAAFVYGAVVINQERPAYIVYAVDRFEVVSPEVDFSESRYPDLERGWFESPAYVYAALPEDAQEAGELLLGALTGGADLAESPKYYEPYDAGRKEILLNGRPIEDLVAADSANESKLRSLLGDSNLAEYLYIPLVGKSKVMSVIIRSGDAEPVGVVDVELW